jgi:hypothetical protein
MIVTTGAKGVSLGRLVSQEQRFRSATARTSAEAIVSTALTYLADRHFGMDAAFRGA